jgi:GT2 family glycosyltransferase
MTLPRVAVIVLNWNGGQDTLDCLASLRQMDYPCFDVLVVDNSSTDGSIEAIRESFPEVSLIETGANLGFTGGNNVGMRHALDRGVDYVLLLNNDTEVAVDLLTCLVDAVEAEPGVGVAGPLIYYYDQPAIVWSAGGAVDRRRGQTRMVGLGEPDSGQYGSTPREVDFVSGCALLTRRSVLEQIGLLDERFFAYYEEVEWCLRARRAGYRIINVPGAKVWHKISPKQRASSPMVHYYMTRNRLLFLSSAGLGWRAWFQALVLDDLRTLLSWTLKRKWRHKRPCRQATLRAIADAGRCRWGNQTKGGGGRTL